MGDGVREDGSLLLRGDWAVEVAFKVNHVALKRALVDGTIQVVDKRSGDRCCFEHFAAVVGLCQDVRDMHDAACWIFQKVSLRRRCNLSPNRVSVSLLELAVSSCLLAPTPPPPPPTQSLYLAPATSLQCDSSGLGFIEKDLFCALLRQLQVGMSTRCYLR